MTDSCVCGHAEDEHAAGVAGCMAVVPTDPDRELFCACWEYDPGPAF